MKASQLITELQTLIDKYGDLPVRYEDYVEPYEAVCYDANGEDPYGIKGNNVPKEFMLH